MNSLIFNTTTPLCTVLLSTAQGVDVLTSDKLYQHGEKLLGFIDTLLSSHQITLAELDVIGLVNGPGSFVGTRLGCAVASAMAFGCEVPVVQISTLQALAQSAYSREGCQAVTVIQDARMQEVYFAEYQLSDDAIMCPINKQGLLSLSDPKLGKPSTKVLVGDAVGLWKERYSNKLYHCLEDIEIDVNALTALVQLQVQHGGGVSAVEVAPCYS